MTSAQEPGSLEVGIRAADGKYFLVKKASVAWWSPGGSPDGTFANTPEKWNYLPPSAVGGKPGSSIEFRYTAAGSDGIDASDCAFQLPVIVNGQLETVGNSANASGLGSNNFTVDLTFADIAATVAAQEVLVYKIRAKEGVYFKVGGDRVNCSIEDDTA